MTLATLLPGITRFGSDVVRNFIFGQMVRPCARKEIQTEVPAENMMRRTRERQITDENYGMCILSVHEYVGMP